MIPIVTSLTTTRTTRIEPASAMNEVRASYAYMLDWLRMHWLEIAIAAVAGIALYLGLRFIRRLVRRTAVKQSDAQGLWATTLRVLARTKHFFLIMVAARLVAGFTNPPAAVDSIIRFLFIVAAAFQAAIWAREVLMSIVRHRAQVGNHEVLGNALQLINVLVTIAFFAIAAIVSLDNLGVNVTGLVAGLGIGGIAIGLAAKGVFEDLFAALAIIFDRPFKAGDTVSLGQTTAKVERIGLKSTRLRALTGEEVIVSNTNLLNQEVKNFASVPRRRMSLDFGVTYETPLEKLRGIPLMVQAIVEEECGHTLVRCGMARFGDSSLDYELQFDVFDHDYAAVFNARHEIAMRIMDRFAAEAIAFAYPVQVGYVADPDGTIVSPYPPALASADVEATTKPEI